MGKNLKPKCKLSRRERFDLDLKVKPIDKKCNMKQSPGEISSSKIFTGYNAQLREKQKVKRTYGLREGQFYNLYKKSFITGGSIFIQMLESRFDNVVYRMGFAQTRAQARQIVSHKLVCINNKTCNIASRILKEGDIVSIRNKARNHPFILQAINQAKTKKGFSWLDVKYDEFLGTFYQVPSDMSMPFNLQLIVELYSKR